MGVRRSLLLAVAAALAGLFWDAAPASAADEASVARGGRLYDNWSRELKDRPPSAPHPLFAARRNADAAETWRCRECHGLDYRGRHGIVGIRARQDADPAAIVALLKDGTHRYGGMMGESDLLDLARFVSHGQVDMQAAIGGTRVADPGIQGKYYGTICAGCHGPDGGRLREIAPLGDLARQRRHEVMHVILNGHPGQAMPALRALGTDFAVRMLAFLQTLPPQNLAVSIAQGGRLYDDWQAETGAPRMSLPHHAYPATAYYSDDAPLTWRCKSCHGWDYQGSRGAYAGGRHTTGIKGIRDMAGADPARIIDVLHNATHRYDAVLKHRDLLDLANFVSLGQVDMDAAIDRRSGRARGDAARAAPYFRTICAACHGTNGQRIITISPLGRVARENPWESLHKIMNGHPNEKMPALRELDRQLLIDILTHLQGLPEARSLGTAADSDRSGGK